MSGKKDLRSGIIFTVFDLMYLFQTSRVQEFKGRGSTPLTNRFIPYFWGSVMLALSIALIIRGIIKLRKEKNSKESETLKSTFLDTIIEHREVIISFLLLFFYLLFLNKIGFIILTTIYLFCEILILTEKEKRRYLFAFIIAAGSSLILYFVFYKGLHVLLPVGILNL